jgi:rod shape-determining protein MreB
MSTQELRQAIDEPVSAIVDAVTGTLDATPPELAADVMAGGIVLAGGGALLVGLPERIEAATGTPVRLAADPRHAVVLGSGQALEEFEALRGVLFVAGAR